MDETMIAAYFDTDVPKYWVEDFHFQFEDHVIHVKIRPNLKEILIKLKKIYEIVVWTAAIKEYADPILDRIDPDATIFKKRLYRDSCIKCDQLLIKDLDIILDRDKSALIIVDNSILSFAFDLVNGVPINSFKGDIEDDELVYLYSFLQDAFYNQDIRNACEESFKLQSLQANITGKVKVQDSGHPQEEAKE